MDRTWKEAKKLVPSDGYNDDGVWDDVGLSCVHVVCVRLGM